MTDPASDQPGPTEASVGAPEPAAAPEEAPSKRRLFRRRPSAPAVDAAATPATDEAGGGEVDTHAVADPGARAERVRPGVLRRRRRALTTKYEQGLFDIGGLALELFRRGMLAEEVMRRRAAEVSDIHGQLEDVENQLGEIKFDRAERRSAGRGPTRHCPSCNTRCRPSANFCASCGAALRADVAAPDAGDDDQPTIVIAEGSDQLTEVIVVPGETEQHTAVIPAPDTEDTR